MTLPGACRYGAPWVLAWSFLILPCLVSANGGLYAIEEGTEVTLGAGDRLDLDCNDFLVAGVYRVGSGQVDNVADVTISDGGTLDGGSGVLDVDGNWTNSGSFVAGTGRVQLLGACTAEPIQVTGPTTFCHLDLSTVGRDYLLPANQTITVLCSLNLGQGNRLRVAGTGSAYLLLGPGATVTGTADLDQVVIRQQDSPPPAPIPAIGPAGLISLALLLGGLAARSGRLRPRASMSPPRSRTA